jgi:hypothetical protein
LSTRASAFRSFRPTTSPECGARSSTRSARAAVSAVGDRDTWASQGVTCFTRSEVDALLSGLSVERLDEEEEDSQDAGGTPKHWHLFHIVARKTPQSSPSQ